MKVGKLFSVMVAAMLIAGIAAVAIADGVITVTPAKLVVTYPHVAKMLVTVPAAVEQTITVQARPEGGDWSTIRSIAATRAALGTTFTVAPRLKVTSGIRAVQGDLMSDVVTISVKAWLSPLQVTHKKHHVTIKGSIAPAQAVGTAIAVEVWQKTVAGKGKHRVVTLTALTDVTGSVYKTNGIRSWWKVPFVAPSKGTYVLKAVFTDADGLVSSSRSKTVKIKK